MPKRKKKTSSHMYLAVGAIASVFVLSFFLFSQSIAEPKPLAKLPIPKIAQISLPEPLIADLNPSQSRVLGAETINPRDVITYVNEERMKRGTRPLRINETLMKAAKMRTDVIMKYQNFSHQDPYEHIQLDTVLPLLAYPFSWATENIGMGDFSGRAFVTGFMNSPSHRANLLDPNLVETGVAIATGPYKQYYVNVAVQLFAIPADTATYLGYTHADVQEYKKLLTDIGTQLDATKKLREKNPDQDAYYETWQQLLIRQQEIIAQLAHTMDQNKPFAKEMIDLLKEYNANWASVPVKEKG